MEMSTTVAPCDVTEGLLCEGDVITEMTHLNTPTDCQAVCQNHPECQFWSHWREEGGEHWYVLTASIDLILVNETQKIFLIN